MNWPVLLNDSCPMKLMIYGAWCAATRRAPRSPSNAMSSERRVEGIPTARQSRPGGTPFPRLDWNFGRRRSFSPWYHNCNTSGQDDLVGTNFNGVVASGMATAYTLGGFLHILLVLSLAVLRDPVHHGPPGSLTTAPAIVWPAGSPPPTPIPAPLPRRFRRCGTAAAEATPAGRAPAPPGPAASRKTAESPQKKLHHNSLRS